MFILDTNILIYYAAGDKKVSQFILSKLKSGVSFLLPTIVVAEFLSFPKITPRQEVWLLEIIAKLRIIELDINIAQRAASLRRTYKIKLGDSIVAATALFTGTTLVTRNIPDFKKILNLKLLKI